MGGGGGGGGRCDETLASRSLSSARTTSRDGTRAERGVAGGGGGEAPVDLEVGVVVHVAAPLVGPERPGGVLGPAALSAAAAAARLRLPRRRHRLRFALLSPLSASVACCACVCSRVCLERKRGFGVGQWLSWALGLGLLLDLSAQNGPTIPFRCYSISLEFECRRKKRSSSRRPAAAGSTPPLTA
jgi:hypothetical protein